MKKNIYRIMLFIFFAFSLTVDADNWPQFRGPDQNQLPDETQLPLKWTNDSHVKWKYKDGGKGWSSPIIWENKVIFTTAVIEDPNLYKKNTKGSNRPEHPTDAVYEMQVVCLDKTSGKEIWKKTAYKGFPKYKTHRDNTFASETPVTDGKYIYTYFGMTGLYCYDMNGNLIWEKDLGNFPMQSNWGTSTSPLLYNDFLYMQIDNEQESFLVALDPVTGNQKWRVSRDEGSNWGTPVIWKNKLRAELVTTGQTIRSYEPTTGKLFWELTTDGGRNISSPVADQELLFTGNEERRGGGGTFYAIRAGATGDITPAEGETISKGVAWSLPKSGISMASPLLYKGLIYMVERGKGRISCYEAANGKILYQNTRVPDAGPFWASPWAFKNNIYCLDENGITHVLEAGPAFKVVTRNELSDTFWATPAISAGTYVFRGVEYLYCIE